MASFAAIALPAIGAALGITGAKKRQRVQEGKAKTKAKKGLAEALQRNRLFEEEQQQKESLRRRVFSGIRTGSPLGVASGAESVGRTRLLGG